MYSLKELLDNGKMMGLSDIQIITSYLTQDGMSKDAINTIVLALTNKIDKVERDIGAIRSNMISPLSFYYKKYDFETAEILDKLTRTMMLNNPFSKEDINWMKGFKLKPSGPFWHDLAEAIKAVQDESYEPHFFNYTLWNENIIKENK